MSTSTSQTAIDELIDLKSQARTVATMAGVALNRLREGDSAGAFAAIDELEESQVDLRFALSQVRLSLRRMVEGGQS